MLLKFILWGIIFYFIYKFVFGVVVPVSKATSQMKDKIREMQDLQQQQQRAQAPPHTQTTSQNKQQSSFNSNAIEGDYIEFEDVK